MKYDAQKIKEIAKRLGVSQETVEQYLRDRVAMQRGNDHDDIPAVRRGERRTGAAAAQDEGSRSALA